MRERLLQGDRFPKLTLNLTSGSTITLPDEAPGRYFALLFYRGEWWPYCRVQLAAYQEKMAELDELGVYVIGGTIEDRETAAQMAREEGITFPIAYGVTPESIGALYPLWGEEKGYGKCVEPMEFLVRKGFVIGSMYASGPVGRMDVNQLIHFIKLRERSRARV